ncbi:MAG: hypothetical protein KDB88_09135, partial [Flavobacteriales bacterium]|nr:hypothetical protein [Flavobacteriales bacterium]
RGGRRSRTGALRALGDRVQRTFFRRHSGTVREVLFEDHAGEGVMLGFTDNYLRVEMPYVPDLVGQLVPVLLERMNGEGRYMAQRPMHGTEDLVPGSLDVPVAL